MFFIVFHIKEELLLLLINVQLKKPNQCATTKNFCF